MGMTTRKRAKIVTLNEHTSKMNREIAAVVGVSLATASRVNKLKQDTDWFLIAKGSVVMRGKPLQETMLTYSNKV